MRKTGVLKTCRKSKFFGKKIGRNGLALKSEKVQCIIRGNVHFGIIVFNCLSPTKLCLRFLLIYFPREIKGFYQGSLGNEVDLTNKMNISPNILPKVKISKNWDTVLYMKEHWLNHINAFLSLKNHCTFLLAKKKTENAFLTRKVNYRKIA